MKQFEKYQRRIDSANKALHKAICKAFPIGLRVIYRIGSYETEVCGHNEKLVLCRRNKKARQEWIHYNNISPRPHKNHEH